MDFFKPALWWGIKSTELCSNPAGVLPQTLSVFTEQ